MNFEILVETAKGSGEFTVQPNSLFSAASTHEALAAAQGSDADLRYGVYPFRKLAGGIPDHPATGDEIGKEYLLLFQANGMAAVFTLNETDTVTSTDQNDAFVSALTQTQELGYSVGLLAKPADTSASTTDTSASTTDTSASTTDTSASTTDTSASTGESDTAEHTNTAS